MAMVAGSIAICMHITKTLCVAACHLIAVARKLLAIVDIELYTKCIV